MRRLVGVLRADDPAAEEYAPQPGLAQLTDLIAKVRASGLPVELSVTGTPGGLSEGEQLVIYRVVQEALTNVLKHAGPRATARVEVEFHPAEVVLRVTDDGRGAAAPPGDGGHGLIGMRERVAVYGGAVEAGPRRGGGFQVTARLPVGRAA
jgi:signal transduction histidine kinase